MKYLCITIVALALLCVGLVQAEDIANVVVVYVDNQNNVQLFRQSTGEKTQLYSSEEGNVSQIYLSPSGQYVALDTTYGLAMYSLNPVRRLFTRQLIAYPYVLPDPNTSPLAVRDQVTKTGVWSPDGSRFAWTEGTPGTGEGKDYRNGDGTIGLFSAVDGRVTILPDEKGMPDELMWSPDSAYLVYVGIGSYGTGAGAGFTGAYVIDPNDKTHAMTIPNNADGIWPIGWLSDNRLVFTIPDVGSFDGVFLYNPPTDTSTQMVTADQYDIDFIGVDPMTSNIYFSTSGVFAVNTDTSKLLSLGLYVIDFPEGAPRQIHTNGEFYPREMLMSGYIRGTPGILRLSDNSVILPYQDDFHSALWSPGAPYALINRDSTAVLLNLDSGQTQVLDNFLPGAIDWFAPRSYFAVVYQKPENVLFMGTVDGEVTHLLDGLSYRFRMTPQMVYESNQPAFPIPPVACPGMLPSRLTVGQGGRVIPDTSANNLRTLPFKGSDVLAKIPAGDSFTVISGPVCSDGIVWWRVNYPPLDGWTAESEGDTYFLEPLS